MKTVHIPDVIHREAKVASAKEGVDLGTWIADAIEQKLAAENEKVPRNM